MKIIQFDRRRRLERDVKISVNDENSNVIAFPKIKNIQRSDYISETIEECKKNINEAITEYRNEINSALNDFMDGLVQVSK